MLRIVHAVQFFIGIPNWVTTILSGEDSLLLENPVPHLGRSRSATSLTNCMRPPTSNTKKVKKEKTK